MTRTSSLFPPNEATKRCAKTDQCQVQAEDGERVPQPGKAGRVDEEDFYRCQSDNRQGGEEDGARAQAVAAIINVMPEAS